MDYKMSSQAHAIEAVDLLRAVGHDDADQGVRGINVREHIISVTADQPGEAFHVVRLVRTVDPDAQPLG
jgi:hypothetical protein